MDVCIAILGATGSGKTAFAIELAKKIKGEIICNDSATVYRGFDIGSSKPTPEQRKAIPHHLVDILEPEEPFSAHHFVELATGAIESCRARNGVPIIAGGTYFYLRALQHGLYPLPPIPNGTIEAIENEYFEDDTLNTRRMHEDLRRLDPASADRIHPNDRYRLLRTLAIARTTGERPSSLKPAPSEKQSQRLWLKYALVMNRQELAQTIIRRTEKMLSQGLVEETRQLLEQHSNARALQSIGYQEAVRYILGKITEKQLRNEIIEKTRQLAKRQICWLRSDPEIRFIGTDDLDRVVLEWDNLNGALGVERS
ncbi:MAG: tRNA (adenosine(37)-N6)-dimethylallyltransferase MiaA [Deltaproteobacteria bacterium]|nr:tRNA (adenosine(37)-N6)-dimethylallyltransferase MiaA [Deltaproteobacteria bacterium]